MEAALASHPAVAAAAARAWPAPLERGPTSSVRMYMANKANVAPIPDVRPSVTDIRLIVTCLCTIICARLCFVTASSKKT